MDLSSNKVLRIIARLLAAVVALIFIAASGIKAFDPAGFAEQIASYHILPGSLSLAAAWFFIIVEFTLAAALLLHVKPELFIPLMMVLLAGFIGVTVYALAQGIGGNCGCFGNVVHRTPQQTLLEDLLMLAALLFSFIVLRNDPRRMRGLKAPLLLAAAALLIAGVTGFHDRLPVDTYVTELRVGRRFTSWPTENLYLDLNSGRRLVFLFTTGSRQIEQEIREMNAVAQTKGTPQAVGLIIDGSAGLNTLVFQYGVSFPIGALEPRFAKNLYRSLPRAFLLDQGVVRQVWNGIPTPAEARAAGGS